MAGSSGRYAKSKNQFFDDEDDVDDETFLQKAPRRTNGAASGFSNFQGKLTNSLSSGSNNFKPLDERTDWNAQDSLEERRRQLLLEKQRIEESTLQSTGRAKGVLVETEQIGVSTAEDLIRQREQLERTATRLDSMNNALRSSEKHIQNIKSVFSSVKNYFSKPDMSTIAKSGDSPSRPLTGSSSSSSGNLAKALEQSSTKDEQQQQRQQQHPALRLRGMEDDFSHKPLSNVDQQLDQDLSDISQSLSRLKGLAQGLGTEIDEQNSLIDRLQTSTDKADWRIQRQNKDMERLLKK